MGGVSFEIVDQLQAEIERLVETIEEMKGNSLHLLHQLNQVHAENERLRAALAFYANEMNWAEAGGFTAAAVEDEGKIARGADVQRTADTRRWADGYCSGCGQSPGKCSCVQQAPTRPMPPDGGLGQPKRAFDDTFRAQDLLMDHFFPGVQKAGKEG